MSEKETGKNLSTQKVLLAGHDPGWNDPPKWAYSGPQTSMTTPTKRLLNKRVAFPLASTQATDKESSPQNVLLNTPPPVQSSSNLTTAICSPVIPPTNKDIGKEISKTEIDKEQALTDVLTNLEAVIDKHISDKNKAEEVKKRLDVLKAAWLEEKLNSIIHKNVVDLSTALREENVEKADRIHVALMMEHGSLCSSWIPGIRHVILALKSKLQNSNVTES